MIRVVLDTNIVISALLTPSGAPAQVLLMCIVDADIQLCVSGAVYAEYEEVIQRPKFKRCEQEVESSLRGVRESAIWVRPTETIRACVDPDDDMILECAQASESHYVVTGNTRHFPPDWAETKIVTARQFLNLIHLS